MIYDLNKLDDTLKMLVARFPICNQTRCSYGMGIGIRLFSTFTDFAWRQGIAYTAHGGKAW